MLVTAEDLTELGLERVEVEQLLHLANESPATMTGASILRLEKSEYRQISETALWNTEAKKTQPGEQEVIQWWGTEKSWTPGYWTKLQIAALETTAKDVNHSLETERHEYYKMAREGIQRIHSVVVGNMDMVETKTA